MSSHTRHLNSFGRITLAALTACALSSQAAQAASPQVGVSVSIAQPGFYGRVDIGDQRPAVIYPQPIIIQQAPVSVHQRPIYLRVPPGHAKNWSRYCNHYRACGQPVYFIQDAPRYDDEREHEHEREHGRGRGHEHGQGKHNRD
ncbi:MAG: hypothetical protein Q7U28_04785 [Aquabacterium sp.]|nr:hypothetical protein [Aquabacterium sp.]